MSQLINEIEELVGSIDSTVKTIVTNHESEKLSIDPNLLATLGHVLPNIIGLYDKDEMAEYKEDQSYWMQQLRRIMEAYEIGDAFLVIDTMQNELAANLVLLKDIIVEKGL